MDKVISLYITIWLASIVCARYIGFNKKLPSTVVPLEYDITLKPTLNKSSPILDGNITISLLILESTNNITLHTSYLQFHMKDVILSDSYDNIINVSKIKITPSFDMCTIIFQDYLMEKHKYDLRIRYSGMLRNDNNGFYLAKYQDDNGMER